MKRISIEDFNNYSETNKNINFYFTIMFEDMSYLSIADSYFLYNNRSDKVVAKIDEFASVEFLENIYKPFILSLKDKKLIEGEVLDEMFNYTYSNTIRASYKNIFVMIHGGSKELFDLKFEDEVISRISAKAYNFFAGIDNSVDRKVFEDMKSKVLEFIKDYQIDKDI